MIQLDKITPKESFIVQKDINNILAVTLEEDEGGYLVLLYEGGQEVISSYKYSTLGEVSEHWGNDNWYI